tara:strand:- start:4595 stop:4930 length:336 start_codon:yes stop_codon:yes gene_type:complete
MALPRRDASRAALIVADGAVRRLRSIGAMDNFTDALKKEYPVMEAAWKESIHAEAVRLKLENAEAIAEEQVARVSFIKKEDMATATIDDVGDLHNEVQVCHLELAGRLNGR